MAKKSGKEKMMEAVPTSIVMANERRESAYGSYSIENRMIDGEMKKVFSVNGDCCGGVRQEFTDFEKFKEHMETVIEKASKTI